SAGWFRITFSIALRPPRRKAACSSRMVSALSGRRLSPCYNLTSCGRPSRKDTFSVQCNLPHILRQHTAQPNRLLYHLRPAGVSRRLSRRHHEITLVGDGTLRFLGLRSLAPTAVSAASMTLFGPSGTTSGAGNATVSALPSITLAFAPASRCASISLMISIDRSLCSLVFAF